MTIAGARPVVPRSGKIKERFRVGDGSVSDFVLKIREENEIVLSEGYLYSHVHYSMFQIAKIQKHPSYSLMDEWIKTGYLYTMECFSAIKREGNPSIFNFMDNP